MNFDEELSEYELVRAQNMKELEALMSDIGKSDFKDTIEAINNIKRIPDKVERKKRKRDDETFRFSGTVPLETRRSARLSNIAPTFSYLDLPDEERSDQTDEYVDINDLERVVLRKSRNTSKYPTAACKIVPVEDISPNYLANIAQRNTVKVYSQGGTSCHQCRQKTTDSKTYCRSGRCIGVRGQFCGVCLKNRYGEEAKDALMNSEWECPPCRGLCNCSICRTREGKRPTGILAPVAFRYGHKSVKDFLISLHGKGDYAKEPEPIGQLSKRTNNNSKSNCTDCDHIRLVGFDKDLRPVSVFIYENTLCSKECDLIGFNSESQAILIG